MIKLPENTINPLPRRSHALARMLTNLSAVSRQLLRSLGSVRPTRTLDPVRICRFHGRMERVVVRCLPEEPKLTISFVLDGSHKHMLRDKGEELGKVLARIANSILKGQGKAKKSKKNKEQQPAEATAEPAVVKLYFNGDAVCEDAVNSDAWQDGAVLHIGDVRYTVQRNVPTFTTAELPASLLAGFPACPKLEVEFGQLRDCEFTWYKDSGGADTR